MKSASNRLRALSSQLSGSAATDASRSGRRSSTAAVDTELFHEPDVPTLDPDHFTGLIHSDSPAVAAHRARVRAHFESHPEIFFHITGANYKAQRVHVRRMLQSMVDAGLVAVNDLKLGPDGGDVRRFQALLEELGNYDASAPVSLGVHYTLFAGAVQNMGTERQAWVLPKIESGEWQGCFSMTELEHGSNVQGLRTTATFDAARGDFVINTPDDGAQKYWIGNLADHAHWTVVFAQLIHGGESKGIHVFLTRCREDDGSFCQGIVVRDCGDKEGLNGVDNGRIWFDHVRVPRVNLLNKFADVTAEGEYVTDIPSAGRRFAAHAGALVGGRVTITASAVSLMRQAAVMTGRYITQRKQFGPRGKDEVPILTYQSTQMDFLPGVARIVGYQLSSNRLKDLFATQTKDQVKEVHVLASGLKAVTTWECMDFLQKCRELCGGHGFNAANWFGPTRASADIFTTFEGANVVLLQQVSKALLDQFRSQFSRGQFTGVLSYMTTAIATSSRARNPVTRRTLSPAHLRSAEFPQQLLEYREARLLRRLATRLRQKAKARMDPFHAWNACLDDVIRLAHAHIERIVLNDYQQAVRSCSDQGSKAILKSLSTLYALTTIEKDASFFVTEKCIAASKFYAVRELINKINLELVPQTRHIVDALGVPENALRDIPIANNLRDFNRQSSTPPGHANPEWMTKAMGQA